MIGRKKGSRPLVAGRDFGEGKGYMPGEARRKAVSVLTAAALAITPFGGVGLTPVGPAFGEDASQASTSKADPLASYPSAVRVLVKDYQDGTITAEKLAEGLRLLQDKGTISLVELDSLLVMLKGGALEAVPDSGHEGGDTANPGQGDGSDAGGAGAGDAGNGGSGSGNVPGETGDGSGESGGSNDGAAGGGAAGGSGTVPGTDVPSTGGNAAGETGGGATADPSAPDSPESSHDAPASESAPASSSAAASSASVGSNVSASGVIYPSSGTYVPRHSTRSLTTEKFIAVIAEQARQIGQDDGLYASVMIAQAILESASGNSALAQSPNNNLFGIKGTWRGKGVDMLTQEDDGTGLLYTVSARFRAYDSITDSLEDYARLLTKSSGGFYQGAWKASAETPARACDFLEGRYATSTSYSESLQDLIATYDLTRFDEPLGYEPVETYEQPAVDAETGDAVLDDKGQPVMEKRTLADLLAKVTSYLDEDYVWGASDPEVGFDCSGLVQYSYREALGIELPRTTYDQWELGQTVEFSDLHPGDLLFFERDDTVYHVAMYLGDGYYIHAPQEGDVVKVTSMEEFMPSFAKRIVETRPVGTVAPAVTKPVSAEPKAVKDFPAERDPSARLMTPFVAEQAKSPRFFGVAS